MIRPLALGRAALQPILALVLVGAAYGLLHVWPESGRRLVVPDSTDFGAAAPESLVVGYIPVRNAGKLPLHIMSAQGDCGCTEVEAPAVLRPGEASRIVVHFNTSGYSRHVTKHITLSSDDGSYPLRSISFEVYVRYKYSLEPPKVDLGSVHFGEPAPTAKTVLWRSGDYGEPPSLRLTGAGDELSASVAPWQRGAKDYSADIGLRLTSVPAVGSYSRQLVLRTSDALVPLRVDFEVEPSLQAEPAALLIDRATSDRASVKLIGAATTDLTAKSQKALVEATLRSTPKGTLLECRYLGGLQRTESLYDSVVVQYRIAGTSRVERFFVPVVIAPG